MISETDQSGYVTNETTTAYIKDGKIYTQKLDKSHEPVQMLVKEWVKIEKILSITPNNSVYYTTKNKNNTLSLYRNDEQVGDIPAFGDYTFVSSPEGKITLEITLDNGLKQILEIDTTIEPRYRPGWIDTRVAIARGAAMSLLWKNQKLESKNAWLTQGLNNANDTLTQKDAEIAKFSAELEVVKLERGHANSALDQQRARIWDLEQDLVSRNESIQDRERELAAYRVHIDRLNQSLKTMKQWMFGGYPANQVQKLQEIMDALEHSLSNIGK